MRIVWLSIGILFSLVSAVTHAQESLCAEVKIEILQEVAMERQGFEALMRITNSLDTFSLENVSVTVNFKDADGNAVIATSNTAASNASFFIRVDVTRNITGFSDDGDGTIKGGVIAPKTIGEMRWLIIPTAKGAGQTQNGKLYFVGAQLKYSYGGKEEVVDVAADSIVVKPQPALTMDYFLTQEVIGDNGFTPEIEAPEPYTLGVRISNNGYGYAKSVKIESAQPTIIENKLGLAVGFKILGSYLDDQPSIPTLLINFGNIVPQGVATGRWIMETNLAGTFTSFNASFTHADELGGTLTSLLQATNANFLIHDVLVDLAGRDRVRDFLAYTAHHDVMVFESETTGNNGANCTNCKSVTAVDATVGANSGATNSFSHLPQTGFSFAKAVDPYAGKKVLIKAVRADGTSVHPQNVWLSKKRAADKINFDYFVNIFDNNSLGIYTLYWGVDTVELPQPPVIQFIPDQITYEGGNLGFVVQATDPNKTIPTLSVVQLPTGAHLNLTSANECIFNWSPAVGQAGIYPITFSATDGALETTRSLIIRVNSARDTDGDGMDDEWEIQHFGDLSHDGLADSDGDGRSDSQEFLDKTDPKFVDALPIAPQIFSPIFDAITLQGSTLPLQPTLTVTNGNHPQNVGPVEIVYEVYKDEGFSQLIANVSASETAGKTSVKIIPGDLLDGAVFEDNHLYYWRAKSRQKTGAKASSPWVKSQFFINTANDAPTAPQISSPSLNSVVADLAPVLSVTNSTDLDRDVLSYSFVIYEESNLAVPVASVSNVAPNTDGQTSWHLPVLLTVNKHYVWKAIAADDNGASTSSAWGSFLVSMGNTAPTMPQIDSPTNGAVTKNPVNDYSQILSVLNSSDIERSPIKYFFELDKVNTFDSSTKRISPAISEGTNKTTWLVNNMIDKQLYYWRVRAFDGTLYSDWTIGQFTFSIVNLPPSVPTIQNPANDAIVTTTLPLIEVNTSVDPEGKAVSYHFQVFNKGDLNNPIGEKILVNPSWQLDVALPDTYIYCWRVRAEDVDGVVSAWSEMSSFSIKVPKVNQKPQLNFVLPNADTVITSGSKLLIQWTDSDPDSDAKITLYATSSTGSVKTIAAQLDENADGDSDQYLWDTTTIAPGQYKISAQISDEESVVSVNSCCVITVREPPPSPLRSQWLFNENSGTQTNSNVNNLSGLFKVSNANASASVIPTLPVWVAGRTANAGSAVKFDGKGSYIELPTTVTAPLLQTASMSFWLKTSQAGGSYSYGSPSIIGNDLQSSRNDIAWGSIGNLGSIGFAIGDARLLSYTLINNDRWHHVVITRELSAGSTKGLVKIYVDGTLNSLGYVVEPQFTGLQNNLVGFGVTNVTTSTTQILLNSNFFNGMLDDVRIYDSVLNATDVSDLYTSESVPGSVKGSYVIGQNGIYEAENATVYLGQLAKNWTGYSGAGFLDMNNDVNSYVEWTIERSAPGNVTAQIVYSNGTSSPAADRPMTISVNDVVVGTTAFPPTANGNTWATASIVVNLKQGINTIRAKSTNAAGGPNVDYLKIQ